MKKLVVFLPLLLAACSSSVHMSQVSQNPSVQVTNPQTVEVETEQTVVMALPLILIMLIKPTHRFLNNVQQVPLWSMWNM